LYGLEDPESDTILKAFRKSIERIPDHPWLGTRVVNEYQWETFK